MLLIDYPAAGRLLGADGAMKSSTWEPEESGSARGKDSWASGDGEVGRKTEGKGGGEGPEFLISDWYLYLLLRKDLPSGALGFLSA